MERVSIREAIRASVIGLAVAVALVGLAGTSRAVVLDDDNRLTVTLSDNTPITLVGVAGATAGAKTHQYYYLPVNLRLARRADGVPEFLFLKFTTEARAEA